ncbi:hypothetical protein GZH46_01480, partial [Fragariocoptes setiger]
MATMLSSSVHRRLQWRPKPSMATYLLLNFLMYCQRFQTISSELDTNNMSTDLTNTEAAQTFSLSSPTIVDETSNLVHTIHSGTASSNSTEQKSTNLNVMQDQKRKRMHKVFDTHAEQQRQHQQQQQVAKSMTKSVVRAASVTAIATNATANKDIKEQQQTTTRNKRQDNNNHENGNQRERRRANDPWYLESPPDASSEYNQPQPMPYRFVVNVRGRNGQTEQYRREIGDGRFLSGSYGYVLPDGIYRHVDYVADARGFRAFIRTSEPGTDNQNPASVVIDSRAPQAGPQTVNGPTVAQVLPVSRFSSWPPSSTQPRYESHTSPLSPGAGWNIQGGPPPTADSRPIDQSNDRAPLERYPGLTTTPSRPSASQGANQDERHRQNDRHRDYNNNNNNNDYKNYENYRPPYQDFEVPLRGITPATPPPAAYDSTAGDPSAYNRNAADSYNNNNNQRSAGYQRDRLNADRWNRVVLESPERRAQHNTDRTTPATKSLTNTKTNDNHNSERDKQPSEPRFDDDPYQAAPIAGLRDTPTATPKRPDSADDGSQQETPLTEPPVTPRPPAPAWLAYGWSPGTSNAGTKGRSYGAPRPPYDAHTDDRERHGRVGTSGGTPTTAADQMPDTLLTSTTPSVPMTPVTPIAPATPVTPSTPATPATPTTPGSPAEPQQQQQRPPVEPYDDHQRYRQQQQQQPDGRRYATGVKGTKDHSTKGGAGTMLSPVSYRLVSANRGASSMYDPRSLQAAFGLPMPPRRGSDELRAAPPDENVGQPSSSEREREYESGTHTSTTIAIADRRTDTTRAPSSSSSPSLSSSSTSTSTTNQPRSSNKRASTFSATLDTDAGVITDVSDGDSIDTSSGGENSSSKFDALRLRPQKVLQSAAKARLVAAELEKQKFHQRLRAQRLMLAPRLSTSPNTVAPSNAGLDHTGGHRRQLHGVNSFVSYDDDNSSNNDIDNDTRTAATTSHAHHGGLSSATQRLNPPTSNNRTTSAISLFSTTTTTPAPKQSSSNVANRNITSSNNELRRLATLAAAFKDWPSLRNAFVAKTTTTTTTATTSSSSPSLVSSSSSSNSLSTNPNDATQLSQQPSSTINRLDSNSGANLELINSLTQLTASQMSPFASGAAPMRIGVAIAPTPPPVPSPPTPPLLVPSTTGAARQVLPSFATSSVRYLMPADLLNRQFMYSSDRDTHARDNMQQQPQHRADDNLVPKNHRFMYHETIRASDRRRSDDNQYPGQYHHHHHRMSAQSTTTSAGLSSSSMLTTTPMMQQQQLTTTPKPQLESIPTGGSANINSMNTQHVNHKSINHNNHHAAIDQLNFVNRDDWRQSESLHKLQDNTITSVTSAINDQEFRYKSRDAIESAAKEFIEVAAPDEGTNLFQAFKGTT